MPLRAHVDCLCAAIQNETSSRWHLAHQGRILQRTFVFCDRKTNQQ